MAGSGLTGFLQNFGGGELLVILVVALVVLGPERLPEMARGAGRMLHRFRTMTSSMSSEVREVIDDPAMQPLRELGELAARPRQKLAEYALEAEAEERAKRERESLAAATEKLNGTDVTPSEEAQAVDEPGGTATRPDAPREDAPGGAAPAEEAPSGAASSDVEPG